MSNHSLLRRAISSRSVVPCDPPLQSLLHKYGAKYPFVDCYSLKVPNEVNDSMKKREEPQQTPQVSPPPPSLAFVGSFFSSPAMWMERQILYIASLFVKPTPMIENDPAGQKPSNRSYGSGFFQVAECTPQETILDSGDFLTWLAVYPNENSVDYRLGSVVKRESKLVQWLLPFHAWYSKFLLASAVRRHHLLKRDE